MSEKKLVTTPIVSEITELIGGSCQFRLPCPAHLVVADIAKLPIMDQFPEFNWFNVKISSGGGPYGRCIGPELLICEQDRVDLTLGRWLDRGALGKDEVLFVPEGADAAWVSSTPVVCLNFDTDSNEWASPLHVIKQAGGAILFSSHRMREPFRLAHHWLTQMGASIGGFVRYVRWTPDEVGKWYANHAYRSGEQIYICRGGEVEVEVYADEEGPHSFILKSGDMLYIPSMRWHRLGAIAEQTFMSVLYDFPYDRGQYLENWEEYQELLRGK